MAAHDPDRGRAAPTFSLVFPTYNAASFLEETWARVERFLERATASWEVLFVCDGCTDDSADRLARLTRSAGEQARVLSYAPNRGKGYAVRHGLQAARGRWRLFTDVDLAYGFEDIERVAATLESGAAIAIASRLHRDSRLVLPPSLQGYAYRRHLQSLAFSALVRRLLPLKVRDTQAGLKGLSAEAVERVLPRLRCDGFGFDCELLVACLAQGLPVAEVPVTVRWDNSLSTTNMVAMRRMLRELWDIRRHWKQGTTVPTRAAGTRRAA